MKQKPLFVAFLSVLLGWFAYKEMSVKELPELAAVDRRVPHEKKVRKSLKETHYDTVDLDKNETINPTKRQLIAEAEGRLVRKERKSRELFNNFSKKIYLKMDGFEGFTFKEFDSSDDAGILMGRNAVGDKLTVLASRSSVAPNQILKLLSENRELIPETPKDFDPAGLKKIMSTGAKNGFSNVTVWSTSSAGRDYYFFLGERADKKGVYGVMLDGEKNNLENNEDYYEETLSNFKAVSE